MDSSTASRRGTPNFIGFVLAMKPGLLLGGSIYLIPTWIILGEPGRMRAFTALFMVFAIPVLISFFARTGKASHWIALVVIMMLTMSAAALATLIPTLFFGDTIAAIESPYIAGLLHGAPALIVSPFVFWGLHRLAGQSSPWALDDEDLDDLSRQHIA